MGADAGKVTEAAGPANFGETGFAPPAQLLVRFWRRAVQATRPVEQHCSKAIGHYRVLGYEGQAEHRKNECCSYGDGPSCVIGALASLGAINFTLVEPSSSFACDFGHGDLCR